MFPPVEGDSNSSNTPGVKGTNSAASGGTGVFGTSNNGEGIHGETNSTKFAAVAGIELNPASPVTAVFGQHNGNGPGLFGTSQGGEGVHGEITNHSAAVGAVNKGSGPAVFGISQGGEGVHGETNSATVAGVSGINTGSAGLGNPTGVFGKSQNGEGVHGETSSDTFAAVAGINNGPSSPNRNPSGVFGESQNGEGVHGQTTSRVFAAVAGLNLGGGTGAGVFGTSTGSGAAGFFTTAPGPAGPGSTGDAVFAITGGPNGAAIHAVAPTEGTAGVFGGDVEINGGDLDVTAVGGRGGAISAVSKHFRIDHPLDPENKYLIHASIESSERLNIYSGIAVLDSDGQAEVILPEWFEALNSDFRYQLTCIGGFAPVYVATKISGHCFRIAGGDAGLEVSWQVTGCRQDRWAREHPMMVVVDKIVRDRPGSKGEYLPNGPAPFLAHLRGHESAAHPL